MHIGATGFYTVLEQELLWWFTHLPRLRGATCMTLEGTDKKGGPRDRLSWHHGATFQCNHRRSHPYAASVLPASSSAFTGTFLLPPRRPLPFRFRDRPLLSLPRYPFAACSRPFLAVTISILRVFATPRSLHSIYLLKRSNFLGSSFFV